MTDEEGGSRREDHEGVFSIPGAGSPLKEGILAWVKGIGSKSRILCLGFWSPEGKAGKELMQEKDFGAKVLPGAGVPSQTCGKRKGSRAGGRRFRSSREPLAR